MDGDDDAVVLRARGGDDGLQEDTAEMMARFRRRERPVAARRRGRSGTGGRRAPVVDILDDSLREKNNGDVRGVRKGKRKRMVQERGCRAHCGDRNRGRMAAAEADYGEQNGRPGGTNRRGGRGEKQTRSEALNRQ